MRVWIDQDLCTGDGLCTDHCPDIFVLLDDGISYVCEDGRAANDPGGRASSVPVATRLEDRVIEAAVDCPGECIFVEADEAADDDEPADDGQADVVEAMIIGTSGSGG
jgi:ferredoxin